jgi:(1->4)-alpha-D-glucan 1-alpha-D-glucosylmutase
VTVATRLPIGLTAGGGWRDTVLELPALELPGGRWSEVLTGRAFPGGPVDVGVLLDIYPVALLAADVVPEVVPQG